MSILRPESVVVLEHDTNVGDLILEGLCGLGLSRTQAGLYLGVLHSGGVEAVENRGDELRVLAELGLVRTELDELGRSFLVATHPRIAVSSLVNRIAWRSRPPDTGRGTLAADQLVDEYMAANDALTSSLESLLERGETPALVAYEDGDAFAAALVDAIAVAELQVRGITARGWLPNIALVWGAICDAMKRKVPYNRLSDLGTWISWGDAINRRDVLETGVRLRIATQPVADKYFIVDETSAFVFETADPEGRFAGAGTMMRNRMLVASLVATFDDAWDSGIPAADAFDASERLRPDYLLRAEESGADAVRVAERIFDFGVYCSYTKDERRVADNLVARGLVRPVGDAFGVEACLAPNLEIELAAQLGIKSFD